MSHSRQGLFLSQSMDLFICFEYKGLLCSIGGQVVWSHLGGHRGTGVMEKGTLEECLKEQEDIFHRDEIKGGLRRGGQGVISGTAVSCAKPPGSEKTQHVYEVV